MAVEVASLIARLGLDKKGFDDGISGAKGALSSFAGNLAAMGANKAMDLVGEGVRAVSDTIVDSVKKSAELEAQISSIGAVSGASEQELNALKNQILDLGMSPDLKVDAFEAANAIEMLARNGLKVEDILGGAAKATVLLSNATGGDFSQSADIATDAMALFGINAKDSIKAVDGITSVVTNSKFSIEDYALALAQGGGVAAAVGVDFDDFNSSIAGISKYFSSGSDAGTSFKTFLQRLIPASNDAKDAMLELGIVTEDGQNRFFDADGNLKSMAEISSILMMATRDLSDEQRNNAMSTIFGTDAMRAAMGIAEMGGAQFSSLQETMAQTDATESAAKMMDNLAGTLEILQGTVDTVKLKLGDALNPTIRIFADLLTDAVGGAGELDGKLLAMKQKLEEFAKRITDANGPAAEFGKRLKDDILIPAGELIQTATGFGDIEKSMQGIEASAMAASPVITMFSGSIKILGDILEAVRGVFDWLDERFASMGTKTNILGTAMQTVVDTFLRIINPAYTLIDAYTKLSGVIDGLKKAWDGLREAMNKNVDIPDWLKPGSPTPFEIGLRGIGKAINGMPELSFGAVSPAPVGASGTTNNYNFGGFAANVTTNSRDGNSEAVRLIMQFLQAELSR